jgi:hypothetical protein
LNRIQVLLASFTLLAAPLAAQETPAAPPAPVAAAPTLAQTPSALAISPRKAMIRAMLIPGWGHASIGEPTRGAFYALLESSSLYMIGRTLSRLGAAKRDRDARLEDVRAGLAARGITDPDAIVTAQDADPLVLSAESLVESRGQQVEDWVAFGLFTAFLSGADAFVSAHLKEFPSPLGLNVSPAPSGATAFSIQLRAGP